MDLTVWDNALSPEVIRAVEQKIAGRKNRVAVMLLLRWMVAMKLWHRTKKGFHLVRGSDPRLEEGLKSNPWLMKLGLTEAKIRGAIKLLVAVGIIEMIPDEGDQKKRFRTNFRLQKRNRPILYRFASWIHDVIRDTRAGNRDSTSRKPSFSSSDLPHKALRPQGGLIVGEKTSAPPMPPQPPPSPVANPGRFLRGKLGSAMERLKEGVLGRVQPDTLPAALEIGAALGREHSDPRLEGALQRFLGAGKVPPAPKPVPPPLRRVDTGLEASIAHAHAVVNGTAPKPNPGVPLTTPPNQRLEDAFKRLEAQIQAKEAAR